MRKSIRIQLLLLVVVPLLLTSCNKKEQGEMYGKNSTTDGVYELTSIEVFEKKTMIHYKVTPKFGKAILYPSGFNLNGINISSAYSDSHIQEKKELKDGAILEEAKEYVGILTMDDISSTYSGSTIKCIGVINKKIEVNFFDAYGIYSENTPLSIGY